MRGMGKEIYAVTGGCGFIGTELVRQLIAAGRPVRIADDLSRPTTLPPPEAEFLKADLSEDSAARAAVSGADVVIHLAGKVGGIGYLRRLPATVLSGNNRLLSTVFEAAAACGVRRFVYVSSSMVYERAERFPLREEDLPRTPIPSTAYGFQKFCGEWYCRAFREERGLHYTILRPFNAYGPGERSGAKAGESHVIPDLAWKLLSGQDPLEVHGDGSQSRCFTHVRDIAQALLLAAEHPAAEDQDFNVAGSEEITIRELAGRLWSSVGRKGPPRLKSLAGFANDVQRQTPSIEKISKILGWKPKVSLENGLGEVVDWLKNEKTGRMAAPSRHSQRPRPAGVRG